MKHSSANRAVFERYLTEAEERQLLQCIAGCSGVLAARDHAWMRLLRQTGIRVETLALLNVRDARDAVSGGRLLLRPEICKGGRGYDVRVNKAADAALRDLLRIRREMGAPADLDAPLIMSQKARGMSIRSFQDRMQHWCDAAGLKVEASPHWWRHTLAQRIKARSESNDPIGIVQVALGHRTRHATAIYTLPTREEVDAAIDGAR